MIKLSTIYGITGLVFGVSAIISLSNQNYILSGCLYITFAILMFIHRYEFAQEKLK